MIEKYLLEEYGRKIEEIKYDSAFLNSILFNENIDVLNVFEKEAWNDENIDLFLNNIRKIYLQSLSSFRIPKGLYDNPKVFEYLIKNGLVNLDTNYVYSISLTEKQIIMYTKFLKENDTYIRNQQNFNSSSKLLKSVLVNNLFSYLNSFKNEAWNEENIQIFKKILESRYVAVPDLLAKNSSILKVCLEKGYTNEFLRFDFEAWNETNIGLFISGNYEIVPRHLYSKEEYLNYCLNTNKQADYHLFKEEAWTFDNIKLFELKLLNEPIDVSFFPLTLMFNSDVLYFLLSNGLYDYINLFLSSAWTNENIDFLKKILKVKHITFIPNSVKDDENLLKYCLENYMDDYIDEFVSSAWNVENSTLYILSFENDKIKINDNIRKSKNFALALIMFEKYDEIMDFPIRVTPVEYLDILFENILSKDKYSEVSEKYRKIEDNYLKENFRNYIIRNRNNVKNIDDILYIFQNISYSNSSEIRKLSNEIADLSLSSDNPKEQFHKIERLFLSNELPNIAKIYGVFRMFHTDRNGNLNIKPFKKMSPVLKNRIFSDGNSIMLEIIIFSDLLKSFLASNNTSLKLYLKDLKECSDLAVTFYNGEACLDIIKIERYLNNLTQIYNQSLKGKRDNYELKGDIREDIQSLMNLYKVNSPSELLDRVVKMFGHFINLDTYDDMMNYIETRVKEANIRSRRHEKEPFFLEEGDYIKGITHIEYLSQILDNGSLASEFLGSSANALGDATPLDTDVSRIDERTSVKDLFNRPYVALDYGDTWLVVKGQDKIQVTRDINGEKSIKYDRDKLEAFYSGVLSDDHYAFRTAFPSSDVERIITREYSKDMGFKIAKSGLFIPVVDTKGNLLFTSEMYDDIRRQMNGLSHYDSYSYEFSDNLYIPGLEDVMEELKDSEEEIRYKRKIIVDKIQEALKPFNLIGIDKLDGDLSRNIYNFVDIGSTGRGVSDVDGDFDFMLLLDQCIINDRDYFGKIVNAIKMALGADLAKNNNYKNDIRLKGIDLNGFRVDIDISFEGKTDMITYSSDMAVKDRFKTMEKISKEKSLLVKANIIMAKRLLKEAKCYKTINSPEMEGGIGGIGVENWILSNGGSLTNACTSFLNAYEEARENAMGKDDYSVFHEFERIYSIWNFGENFYALRNGQSLHNEFVRDHMSPEGLKKMAMALKNYLLKINIIDYDKENKII